MRTFLRTYIAAAVLLLFVSGAAYAQSPKIGYIDLQRVIRDSKAGKAARADFEREFQQKKNVIEQKKRQLDSLKQEFVNNAQVMNESARKQKAEQIENLEKEFNRTRSDFRDDLQKRDLELTQKILQDIEGIIKQIGKSGGYTLILEKTEAGVVYAVDTVDVTDQVIQAYDKK